MAPACHRARRAGIAPCGLRLSGVTYDFCRQPALPGSAPTSFEENFVDFTPESGTITMFSTTWCGYCNRLKKQLNAQGIGYTEINIEEVEGTADLVEQLNGGHRTAPTARWSSSPRAPAPSPPSSSPTAPRPPIPPRPRSRAGSPPKPFHHPKAI